MNYIFYIFMSKNTTTRLVTISKDDNEFLEENCLNPSKILQKKIREIRIERGDFL